LAGEAASRHAPLDANAHTEAELEALRRAVNRGAPYGTATWQKTTAKRLGLE
jgi:hypothetical protein